MRDVRQVVIVDAVRTAIGRADAQRGCFRHVRGDDLAVACVRALLDRTQLAPALVEDVILGCARQSGEHGLNAARLIGLMAGLGAGAGGTTVNRLCGSSLQALHQASHAILAGAADVQIVGGFEHMQRVPLDAATHVNPRLFQVTSPAALSMGQTAEFLAQRCGISRAAQDAFAVRSHQLAHAAHAGGQLTREIIAVGGTDESGHPVAVTRDQCVRPDCDVDVLAKLPAVFWPESGTVTAGNSCPVSDGAAALLVMSAESAERLGRQPLARVRATAVAGVEPSLMGIGPVAATRKVLERAGLRLADIDLIELHEAFASQALACLQLLELDPHRVNVRGGAIALGHPLGASGARLVTTLSHALVDQQARYGLATMCVGMGQGLAAILERC